MGPLGSWREVDLERKFLKIVAPCFGGFVASMQDFLREMKYFGLRAFTQERNM